MTATDWKWVVRYDPAAQRHELFAILESSAAKLRSRGVGEVLGDEILEQSARQMEAIRMRLDSELRIVVAGDFKRGKSSLLNALLKTQVLTTNVAPETLTINEIRYGPELAIDACLEGGARVRLRGEDLAAERLAPLLAQLPGPVSHLDVRLPLPWLERICVVDTPGTGDLLWRFDRRVQEYLFQADVVVFVVSALSPLSESERMFLRLSVLPQELPKVAFVINMLDKVEDEEDAQEIARFLTAKIERLMPASPIFPLSAFDELCRVQSLERPRPERASSLAAAFAAFRAYLDEAVLVNRETIQVDRAVYLAKRMLEGLETKVGLLEEGLAAEAEDLKKGMARGEEGHAELDRRIGERKAESGQRIRELALETRRWLGAFLGRLEAETLVGLARFPLEDLQRHFGFFLVDALSIAVQRCLDAHRPALGAIAIEAQGAVVDDIQAALAPFSLEKGVARSAAGFSFGDAPWTRFATFQLLAHSLQSRLAKLAAELLLKQGKPGEDRRQVLAFERRLREALPTLRGELDAQVAALYDELATRLERQMEETSRKEVEASLAALRRARELRAAAETRRSVIGDSLSRARSAAGEARAALDALDRKLWDRQLVELAPRAEAAG